MKLISSIHKLPLEIFIDCLVDEDYAGLIVEGEPTAEEIKEVWDNILLEFNDAISSDGQGQFVGFTKQYYQTKLRYDKANNYIELLNYYYTHEKIVVAKWIRELNRLIDLKYVFDREKPELFEKYLRSCSSRNKTTLVKMELVRIQLEQLAVIQGNKPEIKPDRSYFTQVMINLKEHGGREIPYTISTFEFCVLVNRYSQYVKQVEAQKVK